MSYLDKRGTYRGGKEKAKGDRSLTAVLGSRNNIVVPV